MYRDRNQVLLPKLVPLQITHGGPVLMMQLDNEYGSYGRDKKYLGYLRDLMRESGVDVPLSSICAYELLFSTDYYEHRLIEVKTMYRRIAPWCTDNVLFFHLISNSRRTIKKAVDQCNEVGLEMIIRSFGSGVNMESENTRYLNRIKKAYDYGHEKGLRMDAYTLAYVKNYRPVKGDEVVFAGTPRELVEQAHTITAQYLKKSL